MSIREKTAAAALTTLALALWWYVVIVTITDATRTDVSDVAFAHRVQLLLDDAPASPERRLLEITDDATTDVAA